MSCVACAVRRYGDMDSLFIHRTLWNAKKRDTNFSVLQRLNVFFFALTIYFLFQHKLTRLISKNFEVIVLIN